PGPLRQVGPRRLGVLAVIMVDFPGLVKPPAVTRTFGLEAIAAGFNEYHVDRRPFQEQVVTHFNVLALNPLVPKAKGKLTFKNRIVGDENFLRPWEKVLELNGGQSGPPDSVPKDLSMPDRPKKQDPAPTILKAVVADHHLLAGHGGAPVARNPADRNSEIGPTKRTVPDYNGAA